MTDPSLPYEICGVVHLVRPLGRIATDLESLRRHIAEAEAASLFYHAIQPPLRAPAAGDLPPDDFSAWVSGVLQDYETAERLSFAIQRAGAGPESLRGALDAVLERPSGAPRSANLEAGFAFLAADSVPVTMQVAADLEDAFDGLAHADASAWFYHLIEQPWFLDGTMPLAAWVAGRGAPRLAERLEGLSHAGLPLDQLRRDALRTWRRSQVRGRVARAATLSEEERADEARDTVARLARRIVRGRETP